ncbi:hypothetical protein NC652_005104 [Populus alba x Populus x berolinensis]|nr:hypothetical protein NC652_005104 [Populus alba x Populus x berolinensis]
MVTRAGSRGEALLLAERVLVMLVKFGGVEPYLLGKSGLARERRVLKRGKSTANSIVNYLHPQTRHAALIFHLIRQDIPKSLEVVALVRYTKFPNSMAGIKR